MEGFISDGALGRFVVDVVWCVMCRPSRTTSGNTSPPPCCQSWVRAPFLPASCFFPLPSSSLLPLVPVQDYTGASYITVGGLGWAGLGW